MNDVVRALAISASMLLAVVVLIVVVSIVTVKRGEARHVEPDHVRADDLPPATANAPAAAAKGGKAAVSAADEISVPIILLLGVGLFTVTVLALFVMSLIIHAM
jgi:hypothetical protein